MNIFIRISIATGAQVGYDLARAGIAGIKSSLKLRRFIMKKSFAIALLAGLLTVTSAQAVTVWYQPTPYPSTITNGVHIWDGWLNNSFNQTFVRDDKLQLGGWGDLYRTYFKFDLKGLPPNVSQAAVWLYPYPRSDSSTPIDVNFYLVTSNWGTGMTWGAQPSATLLGWRAAPVPNSWWGIIITTQYNNWKNSSSTNYGMRLEPRTTPNNHFDVFRSSRYTVNDGVRPLLQLDFTPPVSVPGFKIPLPGNIRWLVTTEIGGYDCKGIYDEYHDGNNYFSIDFSWRGKDQNGNLVYSNPDPDNNPGGVLILLDQAVFAHTNS